MVLPSKGIGNDQFGERGTAVDMTRGWWRVDDKGTERVALVTKERRPWETDIRHSFPRTLMSDTMPLIEAFWAIAEEFDDENED